MADMDFLAVILIGVALWNILPPYIDRWQSTKDYEKLAEGQRKISAQRYPWK